MIISASPNGSVDYVVDEFAERSGDIRHLVWLYRFFSYI